jgi:glycosidase
MTAWTDPHASEIDKLILEKGWFAGNMPDLNLENKELFNYLTQVYIWWIEYAGVDGLRVDTYPYNDIHLAAQFIQRLRDEYPTMNIVGECWVKTPLEVAYYQSGNNNKDGFDSRLPSVMDFLLKDHLQAAFNEQDSWDFGTARFYAHYAQDFAYADVNNVMNFLDNHDIDRFSVAVKRDVKKFKMGLAHLITTRGYPQIYAGTEIMLDGIWGNYEGHRFDFIGGWKEDARNAFTQEGRTDEENEIFDYLRSLLQFRKNATALHTGKMTQFIPYDGIYVFARYNDNQTVLIITNNNEGEKTISLDRYKEIIKDYKSGYEVTTNKNYPLHLGLQIPGKTCFVLNLN